MRNNWKLVSAALGAVAAVLVLAGAALHPPTPALPRKGGGDLGGTSGASPSPAAGRISASGRIEAWREATVRSKGFGRVLRYAKGEGEWVQAGDAVVELDQASERASLAEAEADLFQAERRHKRFAKLRGTSVVSDQELDDVESAYKLASARRDKARAALEERIVRAPFEGRVLKTYLEAGESVSAGSDQPLFVIGDVRQLKAVVEIDELDAGQVSVGRTAVVVPDSMPQAEFAGTVSKVAGLLGRKRHRSDDPRERVDAKVLEVEIALPADPRLRSGMNVTARLQAGQAS